MRTRVLISASSSRPSVPTVETRNAGSLIAFREGCNNYVLEGVYNDMEPVLHQFTKEDSS